MKIAEFLKKRQRRLVTFRSHERGFTLIELLVVIGILAVLLAIVLIAINPARQFAAANNTKRQSDVSAILNAINQYMADNHGSLPANMPGAGVAAVNIKSGATLPVANVGDICSSLVTKYLAALPEDPSINNGAPIVSCASYDSGYQVSVGSSDSRITITAPVALPGATISVTR